MQIGNMKSFQHACVTAAGIVAILVTGALTAPSSADVSRAALAAFSADEGTPQNLITAMKADEGVPQNMVTAMKADEGVPQNLVTA